MPILAVLAGCQSLMDTNVPSDEPFVASNEPGYLGRRHFERADYALAERNFRAAVERNPTDTGSWMGLAASYDHLGRFALADRAYEEALRLSGETFEFLNNRGFSFMLRGDARRAAVMLQRAKSMKPSDPVVSNNLAILAQSRT